MLNKEVIINEVNSGALWKNLAMYNCKEICED